MSDQIGYIEDEWTDEREIGALGFRIIVANDGSAWLEMRVCDEDGAWSAWREEDLDGPGADLVERLPVTLTAARESEREAIVRYLDAAADLWQPVPRAALREASEAIRLGAHLTRTVSATIPHYATLQEAHGPEDAGMTKPETVAFLEGERQRLAEEVRGLRAGMFDLQLAVGGSSCLDAVRGATTAEREAIAAFIERSYSPGDHVGDLAARLRVGAHHATLQEAQGPDSATPSASADSCARKGGTDSSPETSG